MSQQPYTPPPPPAPPVEPSPPAAAGAPRPGELVHVPGVDSHGNPTVTLALVVAIEDVEDVAHVREDGPDGQTTVTAQPVVRKVASVVLLPGPTRVPVDTLTR